MMAGAREQWSAQAKHQRHGTNRLVLAAGRIALNLGQWNMKLMSAKQHYSALNVDPERCNAALKKVLVFYEVRSENELISTVRHIILINRPVSEVMQFPISRQYHNQSCQSGSGFSGRVGFGPGSGRARAWILKNCRA